MPTLRDRFAAARAGWVSGRSVRAPKAAPGWAASSMRSRRARAVTPATPPVPQQSRAQTVFQAVTALTAVAALLFTARSLDYTADVTRATQDQIDLAAQGQVAERFSQAIDQLGQTGPDKLSIRLGGIYSLERLMRDSPDDEPTVIEVLCAFIRTNARRPATPVGPTKIPEASEDVRAAVTVLGRRPNPGQKQNRRIDFTGTQLSLPGISLSRADLRDVEMAHAYLRAANLDGAHLGDASLRGADLRYATLGSANLSRANLNGANLSHTNLSGADLRGTDMSNTDLIGAYLEATDLDGANLSDANLRVAYLRAADLSLAGLHNADLSYAKLYNANLQGANLSGANLSDARLEGANLEGANLNGADLSRSSWLTSEMLRCSKVDKYTRLPPGVIRPPDVPVSERPSC